MKTQNDVSSCQRFAHDLLVRCAVLVALTRLTGCVYTVPFTVNYKPLEKPSAQGCGRIFELPSKDVRPVADLVQTSRYGHQAKPKYVANPTSRLPRFSKTTIGSCASLPGMC